MDRRSSSWNFIDGKGFYIVPRGQLTDDFSYFSSRHAFSEGCVVIIENVGIGFAIELASWNFFCRLNRKENLIYHCTSEGPSPLLNRRIRKFERKLCVT